MHPFHLISLVLGLSTSPGEYHTSAPLPDADSLNHEAVRVGARRQPRLGPLVGQAQFVQHGRPCSIAVRSTDKLPWCMHHACA